MKVTPNQYKSYNSVPPLIKKWNAVSSVGFLLSPLFCSIIKSTKYAPGMGVSLLASIMMGKFWKKISSQEMDKGT